MKDKTAREFCCKVAELSTVVAHLHGIAREEHDDEVAENLAQIQTHLIEIGYLLEPE